MEKTKEIAGIHHARGHLTGARKAMGGGVETKKAFLRDQVSGMSNEHLHHTLKYISPGTEVSPQMTKEELKSAITFAIQGISVTPPQSARDRAVKRWIDILNRNWRRADDFILDIMMVSEDSAIRRDEMLRIVEGIHDLSPEAKKRAATMNKAGMMSLLVGSWKRLYYHDTVLRVNNSEKRIGHLRLLFGQGGIR